MGAVGARRRWLVAVAGLALAAAACGGGGGGSSSDDPLVGNSFENPATEKILQFTGVGKARISGTLTLPTGVKGPVPAVLIVPSPGLTNRDGRTVGAPIDVDREVAGIDPRARTPLSSRSFRSGHAPSPSGGGRN